LIKYNNIKNIKIDNFNEYNLKKYNENNNILDNNDIFCKTLSSFYNNSFKNIKYKKSNKTNRLDNKHRLLKTIIRKKEFIELEKHRNNFKNFITPPKYDKNKN